MFALWCITGVAPFALAWALGKFHGPLWPFYVIFPLLFMLWLWVTAAFLGTLKQSWGEWLVRCLQGPWLY